MTDEGDRGDELDEAIGQWFVRNEEQPDLLPGQFAATLREDLRAPFLRELEALGDVDRFATGMTPRGLPLRFGDFRVLGELGRGAMGVVYAAEQVATGRAIALKVMHEHVAAQLSSAARFRREARTAAQLQHPGIVPVLDFGEERGLQWLAMARIEGRSLQRLLIAADDPRDIDHAAATALLDDHAQLARVLADAADALAFAHRQNVVHRDVKPANLVHGDDGRIVILDFGLATARDADTVALTRTGDLLGTPLYMSPEQAIGAENGTPANDIYSLGAVLYECLCRRPPVPPGPLATVIDAILNRDAVDPRRRRPGVPAALARIALQCLEKNPERRYKTAEALADDLRRFVDGASVHARHHGVVGRLGRRIRRRPVVAALVVAILALVPVVYGSMRLADRREAEASALERTNELTRTHQLLALSPEGCTVAGGASRRYYTRLGLGDYLPAAEVGRSATASEALAIAQHLVERQPDDGGALRTLARVLFDLGDEPERMERVLQSLLARRDATAADRAMAAVWWQQQGRIALAEQTLPRTEATAPGVAFWLGIWHQNRQDYFAALQAFDRALGEPGLDEELRYFAHLHRGWCQTCPDICRIRAAEDDLLQAAALRPNYGTARLLWAALRCLDPQDDLSRPVAAVGEVLNAVHMEPWVVVLTARVLLALAEGSTWQAGPVRFAADFSPIAVLPLPPGRAPALAGKGLELLDAVAVARPELFEPQFHRIAALTLLGRHAEALAAGDQLIARSPAQLRPAILLQQARVHLAAGHAQIARQLAEQALRADDGFVAAWRFVAEVDGHVGDLRRQLAALEQAARRLTEQRFGASVFPDGAVALPDMQLQRARVEMTLGDRAAALEILQRADFGGVLAGEFGPRVALQRARLTRECGAGLAADTASVVPAGSPLQLLSATRSTLPRLDTASLAAGLQRRWLAAEAMPGLAIAADDPWAPATASLLLAQTATGDDADFLPAVMPRASDPPTSPAALFERLARGGDLRGEPAPLPVGALLPHLRALLGQPGVASQLTALAKAQCTRDADNGEARLLLGSVLLCRDEPGAAASFLAASLDRHPDDLRARFVLAAAALAGNDRELLRRAVRRDRGPLDAAALEAARAALGLPVATTAAELLAAAR